MIAPRPSCSSARLASALPGYERCPFYLQLRQPCFTQVSIMSQPSSCLKNWTLSFCRQYLQGVHCSWQLHSQTLSAVLRWLPSADRWEKACFTAIRLALHLFLFHQRSSPSELRHATHFELNLRTNFFPVPAWCPFLIFFSRQVPRSEASLAADASRLLSHPRQAKTQKR